jgi:hypothetical protein
MNQKVTVPDILAKRYSDMGITDFPKTRLGLPDMRRKFNHQWWGIIEKQIEKEKEEQAEQEAKQARERLKSTFQDVHSEPCAICYEPKVFSHATLKCSHSYCLDCFIKHCRSNNKCPLCRDEFAPMIKKPMIAPEEYKEAIAYMAMKAKQHNHQGDVLELPQYIYAQLNDYATTKREDIFNEVMDTIHLTVLRSIRATCKYYDTQLASS